MLHPAQSLCTTASVTASTHEWSAFRGGAALGFAAGVRALYAGPGLDTPVATLEPLDLQTWAVAGDLDGDGADDLVVAQFNGPTPEDVPFYLRPLAGPDVAPAGTLPVLPEGQWTSVATADADGDGLDDVWTSEACLFLSPLPAAGAVPASCATGTQALDLGYGGMASGDVDGDGHDDVAIGGTDAAWVLSGVPASTGAIGTIAWLTANSPGDEAYDVALVANPDGAGVGSLAVVWDPSDFGGLPAILWTVDAAPGVVARTDGRELGESGPILGGDFDGDGAGDLVFSAGDDWGPAYGAGVAWILWGAP